MRLTARIIRLWLKNLGRPTKVVDGPRDLAAQVRSIKTILRVLGQKKFSRFDSKVYYDIYTPRFPSPMADRLIESTVLNLDDGNEPGFNFIPNVDLAITGRCMFRCEHCYAADALNKKDLITVDQWKAIIDAFQEVGTGVFSLVGGEPLLRFDDMCTLIEHARDKSDVWTVTAGWSLTPDKAKRLRDAGLIGAAVSLDHYEADKHNKFRGNPKAFDAAARAVEMFADAGIYPAVAACATRDVLQDGGLDKYVALAGKLGAGLIQLVEPIRSGQYLNEDDVALSVEELRLIQAYQRKVNTAAEYRDAPGITSRTSLEDSDIGVGCGAGGNTFIYVDPTGNLQPCPLMNVSTGNVFDEGFHTPMRRMRDLFPRIAATGAECPANALYKRIAQARERTGRPLPVQWPETAEICADFKDAPLPPLYGGHQHDHVAFDRGADVPPEVERARARLKVV